MLLKAKCTRKEAFKVLEVLEYKMYFCVLLVEQVDHSWSGYRLHFHFAQVL